MTDAELAHWLSMMGKTKPQRIAAVTDLLRHASGDGMSDEDRAVCLRALRTLGTTYISQKVGATHVTPGMRSRFFGGTVELRRARVDKSENSSDTDRVLHHHSPEDQMRAS